MMITAQLTGHLPLLLCELYDVEVVCGGLGADTHPGEVPLQEVAGDNIIIIIIIIIIFIIINNHHHDLYPGKVPLQEVAGDSTNIESEEDSK